MTLIMMYVTLGGERGEGRGGGVRGGMRVVLVECGGEWELA